MVMLVYQRVMMILQIANDEISSGFSITNQMIWGYIYPNSWMWNHHESPWYSICIDNIKETQVHLQVYKPMNIEFSSDIWFWQSRNCSVNCLPTKSASGWGRIWVATTATRRWSEVQQKRILPRDFFWFHGSLFLCLFIHTVHGDFDAKAFQGTCASEWFDIIHHPVFSGCVGKMVGISVINEAWGIINRTCGIQDDFNALSQHFKLAI